MLDVDEFKVRERDSRRRSSRVRPADPMVAIELLIELAYKAQSGINLMAPAPIIQSQLWNRRKSHKLIDRVDLVVIYKVFEKMEIVPASYLRKVHNKLIINKLTPTPLGVYQLTRIHLKLQPPCLVQQTTISSSGRYVYTSVCNLTNPIHTDSPEARLGKPMVQKSLHRVRRPLPHRRALYDVPKSNAVQRPGHCQANPHRE